MNLSDRLKCILNIIPNCNCLADIGTDHGYIPIFALQDGICKKAIASDIKKGPIKIADKNIQAYGLKELIETRVGPGLTTLTKGEADVILIAGMGGIMIADILEENLEIASASLLILQPVQHPEELRKYLLNRKFDIIDEEISKEGNKYYHIIKVKKPAIFNENEYLDYKKEVFFYIGIKLMQKNHPLLRDYIDFKIKRLNKILMELSNSENELRKKELINLKYQFEEVKACLKAAKK